MKTTSELTDTAIKNAKAGAAERWMSDAEKGRGQGVLCLRISPNGTKRFYFRYTAPDGSRVRLPIGNYNQAGRWGSDTTDSPLTLKKAREVVTALQSEHQKPESRDIRAFRQAQEDAKREAAAEVAQAKAEEAARLKHEREAIEKYTLRKLLEAYVAHLKSAGKVSADNAAGIFRRNVYRDFPDLAARPASSITAKEVVAMLRKLTELGKGRTAAKLRSYLHAAYALTLRAELDPDAPADLVRFNLTANPVAPTGTLARYNQARDRTLTEAELRAYWTAALALPDVISTALRLALLLGGQRPAQLLRVEVSDVDLEARTITLRDGKGARKQPRIHVLPLATDAHAIVSALVARAAVLQSPLLFTLHGKRGAVVETLSSAVHGISSGMVEAKTATAPFQMRDIRRTCETMLAAMGISSDIRAQLQSHGLGGVQAKHYDRHSYASEKAAALEAWQEKLRGIVAAKAPLPDNVVPIRRERAKRSS
jgi:integrase